MSVVSFHITMRRMFTRRIVRFLYGSQKRIMGWHSVRKWKRPIPSILRARPRANDEEYGAHDAPKRKTGDMDQVGFRAANFSQKTAKRTCASHSGRQLKAVGKRVRQNGSCDPRMYRSRDWSPKKFILTCIRQRERGDGECVLLSGKRYIKISIIIYFLLKTNRFSNTYYTFSTLVFYENIYNNYRK